MSRPQRLFHCDTADAINGTITWSPVKSIWFTSLVFIAVVGAPLTVSWSTIFLFALLTAATLCFGHSVGLHRLLIHRSFRCPKWLEYAMVYTGVVVGMGGPRRVILMHEMRDWAQRQIECHPFFKHQSSLMRDALWNLHCECRLVNEPTFKPESRVANSEFYRLLDRYWMAAQLPLAMMLYFFGGWGFLIWGIALRVPVSLLGHWFVGYLAHNYGEMTWRVDGASVQGYNLHGLGLITMGEAWHNNHHAFPDSARLGLERGQNDPGWWLLVLLQKLRLVTELNLPEDLPPREELVRIDQQHKMIGTFS